MIIFAISSLFVMSGCAIKAIEVIDGYKFNKRDFSKATFE